MYYIVNQPSEKQSQTLLLTLIMGGLVITTVQQLAIFAVLSVEWHEPIRSVLEFLTIFSFDLEVVRVGCIFGSDPVTGFAMKVFMILACILILGVVHMKWLSENPKSAQRAIRFYNAVGFIFMALYISIAATTFSPFQCYDHPNGMSSVKKYPTVFCGDSSEHDSMVAIGIFAVLMFPGAFLSAAVNATLQYPARVSNR